MMMKDSADMVHCRILAFGLFSTFPSSLGLSPEDAPSDGWLANQRSSTRFQPGNQDFTIILINKYKQTNYKGIEHFVLNTKIQFDLFSRPL